MIRRSSGFAGGICAYTRKRIFERAFNKHLWVDKLLGTVLEIPRENRITVETPRGNKTTLKIFWVRVLRRSSGFSVKRNR